MKKIYFAIFLVTRVLCSENATATSSGSCALENENGNCQWSYDENTKTLTISGQGQMPNADIPWGTPKPRNSYLPWSGLDYETVVVSEGITSVSNGAFMDSNVKNISLPESVTKIGEAAFHQTKLENVNIPSKVTEIGDFALSSNKLSAVVLPEGLTELTNRVIYATNITSVAVPESVTTIHPEAFAYLDGHSGAPLNQVYCSIAQQAQCEAALIYRGDNVNMVVYENKEGVYILKDDDGNNIYYASADDMAKGPSASCDNMAICKAQVLQNRGFCSSEICADLVAASNANMPIEYKNKSYASLDDLLKGKYMPKRIYTVQEANQAAGKKNTLKIRYK